MACSCTVSVIGTILLMIRNTSVAPYSAELAQSILQCNRKYTSRSKHEGNVHTQEECSGSSFCLFFARKPL